MVGTAPAPLSVTTGEASLASSKYFDKCKYEREILLVITQKVYLRRPKNKSDKIRSPRGHLYVILAALNQLHLNMLHELLLLPHLDLLQWY